MDEKMQRKLLRQLRGIRVLLGLLLLVMLIGFGTMGYLAVKAADAVKDAKSQIQDIQAKTDSTLEFKDRACSSGLLAETAYCTN